MMLALGIVCFYAPDAATPDHAGVNQIIAGRQIPVSVNGMPTSFSALARKT
ncbi:phage protein gpU [Escherichia coli DEC4A]|nr:phage protein gpU [Escherichia coli DEC4A]